MSDKTDHPPVPEAFTALGIRPSILKALAEMKFTTPSEIQALLIPRALAGVDLLGQARTGTGKTAAFAIPILQRVERGVPTQAIILVPTRELAVQVDAEFKRIASHTPIRSVPVYGGQKIVAQMKFLRHHPEVIIGTPGRVIDLLDRRILSFENVKFAVLDEVDRMLDIGFRDDIRNILSRIKGVRRDGGQRDEGRQGEGRRDDRRGRPDRGDRQLRAEIKAMEEEMLRDHTGATPDDAAGKDDDDRAAGGVETRDDGGNHQQRREAAWDAETESGAGPNGGDASQRRHQTIFVSATISAEIEKLARQYMREPVEKLIAPGADEKPTVEKVEQYYFSVQPWDKYRLLRMLLLQENPELAIVFCKTKRGAEKLAKKLHADGIECREIHGNLAQNKRDRVMQGFRKGKFDVLIATDLASRGIDVADISHIINYDIPEDPEVYVHRVGRTARMGAQGKAFTFVTREQGDELTKVEGIINMVIPQAKIEGFEPNPTPADWTEAKPGMFPDAPSKPVQSRLERPLFEGTGTAGAAPVTLPPRTIGSKIPLQRRHKRRR
ncbi:MAG TPA: DEAD/DEAH box helicase [Tepidisphaeraceae bacterium]|nr:DEAD/DEAH box helicase [Tepidisphaeraceae bacterium]